jgi:hypothetical protein
LEHSPFEFTDISAKKPWDEDWKRHCRSRIKGCDGAIALVSRNTEKAAGQLWEVRTAKEEAVPIIGIYVSQNDRPGRLPVEFNNVQVRDWTWENIRAFLARL